MEVFVCDFSWQSYSLFLSPGASVGNLIHLFSETKGIPETDFYVKSNGRLADQDERLLPGQVYRLEPRLCGGKGGLRKLFKRGEVHIGGGGFGSMLRALGAQIEKTTNREACRDLSGRRLRDVNHEKEMAEWLKKQAEREAEKEQRRLEQLQRKLAEPKHYFTDPTYEQQCHEMSERLEDSVLKGMQASSSGVVKAEDFCSRKRPTSSKQQKSCKKICFWTGVDGLEELGSSEDDSDATEEEGDSPSTSGVSSGAAGSPARRGPAQCGVESSSTSSPEPASPQSSPEQPEKEAAAELPAETETTRPDAESTGTSSSAVEEQEETQPIKTAHAESERSTTQPADEGPLDLLLFSSVTELEGLGLERLKMELMHLGLKCGGTLPERAARLFSVRGLAREQIDPSLFAKPAKGKK